MRNAWLLTMALVALIASPTASADCSLITTQGAIDGVWDNPISIGPNTIEWDPTNITDADLVNYLDAITLTLQWSNDQNGGADFGIAVGTNDNFQYWNPTTTPGVGAQTETITLDRNDLLAVGWTGNDLIVGPSISTGGGSIAGIEYTLDWSVELNQFRCEEAQDSEGGLFNGETDGISSGWWIAIALAGVGTIALIVVGTIKR